MRYSLLQPCPLYPSALPGPCPPSPLCPHCLPWLACCTGSAHLLASAAWTLHGNFTLAHAHALTYLACYGRYGQADNTATALGQLVTLISENKGENKGADPSSPSSSSSSYIVFTVSPHTPHPTHQQLLQQQRPPTLPVSAPGQVLLCRGFSPAAERPRPGD